MLKFYPDHVPARVPRLFGDMLAASWTVAWAAAGLVVYRVIMALEVVADGISSTGRTFNGWLEAFKSSTPRGIPGLSNFLLGTATALERHSGTPLIASGAHAHEVIQQMAVLFGLVTALPPILIVGGTYAYLRLRDAREMGAALAFVRAAERSGRLEQARAVLAYRAVASLPFTKLMRASSDPVGDLSEHRYDRLAAEMLKRAGLESFRLHDPGRSRLEPAPPADVRRHGDEQDQDGAGPEGQVRGLGPG